MFARDETYRRIDSERPLPSGRLPFIPPGKKKNSHFAVYDVIIVGMKGRVASINISDLKGERKKPVHEANIISDFGIEGDAHASPKGRRQVSLLAVESIDKMRKKGLDVHPGDFAENITTEGIDLLRLPLGTKIHIGADIVAEVSRIGKKCRSRCAIYYQAGDCVMPREGIFVRIIKGGTIKKGDEMEVVGGP